MIETHASKEALLRLYGEAIERQNGRRGPRGIPERRAAFTERPGVLTKMRRVFQDQQAEGLLTPSELRDRLAELDEKEAAISSELRAADDATEASRRIAAARSSLLSAEWFESPRQSNRASS